MISVATAARNAHSAEGPQINQPARVSTDSTITIGTKTPEMESASR